MKSPTTYIVCVALMMCDFAGAQTVQTDEFGRRAGGDGVEVSGGPMPVSIPDWTFLGPFGGDVADVAVSTVDPEFALAGIAPSGSAFGTLYRSTDGAATWTEVTALSGTSVYDIEFTPTGIVYIGTQDSVWKSTDNGANWTQLNLDVGPADQVHEVAIDPANESNVWAGIEAIFGQQPVNVVRSTDGGTNWTDVTPPLPSPLSAYGIAFDPGDSNRVSVCFRGTTGFGAFWVTTDGGTSWVNRSAGLPDKPLNAVVHDGTRLLVAGGQTFNGQDVDLYSSDDEGVTWIPLHDGTWPNLALNDIDLDPNNSDVIYLTSARGGVFRSTDGGANWTFGIGGTGSLSLNSVRFAPGSSTRILVGGYSVAVHQSTDAGGTFSQASNGIAALNVFSVAANPNDIDELAIAFQGLNDGGVYTSTNGGITWDLANAPATRYNAVRFAPNGTLYAISGGPSTVAPEGLYRRDAGDTWTGLGPDQGSAFESELITLRFSHNNPNLILAGGADFGNAGFEATVWRSTDAGANWTKAYEGPTNFEDVTDIEIIEDGTDAVMLASFTDTGDEPRVGGVLHSADGGATWSVSSTGLAAETQGTGLCASPADPNVLYYADSDAGNGGGVFQTVDGGLTWMSTGFFGRVMGIASDPVCGQRLYIVLGNNILRSTNDGASFSGFSDGLAAAGEVQSIEHSAASESILLLATKTGTYARFTTEDCMKGDVNQDGLVNGLDIALFVAFMLNTSTPPVVSNEGFEADLNGWTLTLTPNGASPYQNTFPYDIDGPGPLGTSNAAGFGVGQAGPGDPGGIELTQNIQLDTGTSISIDLSIHNGSGSNNPSGGIIDLIVDGASVANHTTGEILEGEILYGSLTGVYNGPSGLHDVGVRIVRPFSPAVPPYQIIDNFTLESAAPFPTLEQSCAADVADTPDCAVGLDDLPNFVTCLLQSGCP